jgi:hypothetical protein
MRAIPLIAALTTCSVYIACTPAEPANTPPTPTATVTVAPPPAATATADPAPEPLATAAPTADPAPPEPPPPPVDLVDSPGDPRLDSAAALLKAGDHQKARAELEKVMPEIDKAAKIDVKMAAHVLLARACRGLKDEKCAASHLAIARASWKDPAVVQAAIDAAGGDEKAKLERMRRALNAAGEAMFYAAEEKRLAAEKEKYPVYSGKGDRESVHKHITTKVAAWVKARRALIEDADKAYTAVTQIQPVPPPRWVVASAARVGQMWSRFVAEFRAAPIPAEWKGTGPLAGTTLTKEEVRASYYAALDEASAPQATVARATFKTCQDLARKFGVSDDYSKTCDAWLAKNTPAATPAAAPTPAPAPSP